MSSIESLVNEIKKDLFSNQLDNTFVTQTSAYDIAWLAMIPCNNQEEANGPMFESCLNWILNNQNEQGYWGELSSNGENNLPNICTLPTTLACMVALKKWNVGESHITKGLKFIHANMDTLLKENSQCFPHWFIVVFPSILQLAKAQGLEIIFVNGSKRLLSHIIMKKKALLESEKLNYDQPHLEYLEKLSNSDVYICVNEEDEVFKNLYEENGSLYQSLSATAQAFMATGNKKYLMSIVQKYPNGVPSRFPVDEELKMLCMIDNIQRMGLAKHFEKEIEQILDQIYNNYQINLQNNNNNNNSEEETSYLPEKLFKDSLAFRLLRMQGYKINQGSFCWFVHQPQIKDYIAKNKKHFTYVMYNVYRATDLMFNGESEMEEARSFSRDFLLNNNNYLSLFPALQKVIEHELNVPWFARLEHLDHRLWIELNQSLPLFVGKSQFYWLSYMQNDKLTQLAVQNYEYRQSIYRKELEDLKRWSKEKGLVDIGFGREKTTYSYFASAASSSNLLPYETFLRLIVAKCSIVITVADDFYDEEASLSELQILTEAIQRWDAKNLDGPSKIIFEALDDLWKETFHSWMMESLWSRSSNLPSMDKYLEVGMLSIGAHILVLHAASLGCPTLPSEMLGPINGQYENITKLLMATTRLLNDIQSYQKEREVGKMNYTLLHFNENPSGQIEDSIDFVKEILREKKKEFLENVVMDIGFNNYNMPRTMKLLHLSCLNVFHMFFNSCNLFDTKTAIIEDIMRAIYIPLIGHQQQEEETSPILMPLPLQENKKMKKKIEIVKVNACVNEINYMKQQDGIGISFVGRQAPNRNYNTSFGWSTKGFASHNLRLCFM
ncbi:hypothetical protein HAX54_002580 [Datura stramonium]|uniref:Terpene synthase N-terminal domain-containing protein n=1 Tax=Datura stramonium TaxID=4076 RepID=A0ABS8T435_DATST|nr:hypothetical protein [Datura stramonium]